MDQTHPDFEEQHGNGGNFQCFVVKKDKKMGPPVVCSSTVSEWKTPAISHFKGRSVHLDTPAYTKATD
jgi:hypothetical protein